MIVVLEFLLFADVHLSHRGALHEQSQIEALTPPATAFAAIARWTAINFTALVWPAYIVLLDGLLVALTGTSPIRSRPHHFALLCLASIPVWCLFDIVNFYFIHAWYYLGVPAGGFFNRVWAYVFAFGAVTPGMFLASEVYLKTGLFRAARANHASSSRVGAPVLAISFVAGMAMFLWPLMAKDPITNLTLWTSLVFLLDPINYLLNRPSFLRDVASLNIARPMALMAGGLTSGLLWEFWNYFAIAKWIYHLPFLGSYERFKYFEMPLPGLLGFLPFGLECWVMWQTLRIPFDGLAEPLTDEASVL